MIGARLKCMIMVASITSIALCIPYIELNTKDSWFSHHKIDITWTIRQDNICLSPLNTTLNLVDCGNNGQIVKSASTERNGISIETTDFNNPNHFYMLSAKDNACISCGQLSYLFRTHPYVQTEVHVASEGGVLCLDLSNISFQSPLYAFWPREIGSTTNCYCPLFFSTLYSFADCYCIRLKLTEFTVSFNETTVDLCWQNLASSMNGSTIGIVSEENTDCGEQMQLSSRIFLKMIAMLIQNNTLVTTSATQTLGNVAIIPEISSLVMSSSTIQVTSSIEISLKKDQNTTNFFVVVAAGISAAAIVFVLAIILIVLATIFIWKTKAKKKVLEEPVYESPRFSTEVAEPLYEDITLPPIDIATMVATEINEAYAVRKLKSKHTTAHNITMEENEAYHVLF